MLALTTMQQENVSGDLSVVCNWAQETRCNDHALWHRESHFFDVLQASLSHQPCFPDGCLPRSVLLIAVMLAYYIVTAFQVWKWSDRTINASRVPWPDWAWAMGAGAAVCWFIAAGVASGGCSAFVARFCGFDSPC